ncbi:Lrp/AsnC ligand binding domain-containing protein [Candidatus Bathyarchaeota archaeon]|nr:Lrp/AsnC ligand binding domain-containing protein [Candidatus Bathyarchaeota archaeon]
MNINYGSTYLNVKQMTDVVIVLMTLETDTEREVLKELRQIPNVTEAHFLYGPYDAYARVEANTTNELQTIVLEKIRLIKGIRSTTTCFIAD